MSKAQLAESTVSKERSRWRWEQGSLKRAVSLIDLIVLKGEKSHWQLDQSVSEEIH